MSRQLRIEYPGAVYHVYARGNARQNIFLDNEDRLSFLAILAGAEEDHNFVCHADCLMDNHYHLELETPDGNLSKCMKALNAGYAQAFNRRHGRVGKLFQGRYGAKLVQKEAYLLSLCRYIVLNPVRAGMVEDPAHYRWSSYRATAGLEEPHPARSVGWVLSQFSGDIIAARLEYADFVRAEVDPKRPDEGMFVVGNREFAEQRIREAGSPEDWPESPRRQKFTHRPPLTEILHDANRDCGVAEAVLRYGYSQAEVAEVINLKKSRVSQIICKARED
ncbi:MAG: transposase [Patescibacteria group bacterium]|nr:transposase [Patescibacteria group bacterium]